MKNNIFAKTIIFFCLVVFVFGCDETTFLDRPPIAQRTDGSFPLSEKDLLLATNGAYNTLRIWQLHDGGFPLLNIVSDDMSKGSNPTDQAGTIIPYDQFTYAADQGFLVGWWAALYQGVRRTNLVINRAAGISMDEDLKNRYIGEARFLRGYFYGDLIRVFGDVPKVLEVNPSASLSRSPVSEIMEEIVIPDLEFAIANLPEKSDYDADDAGRATRGAARAMLARLYLFFGNFQKVEQLTQEIISSGQYNLEPNYQDAFTTDFEYGQESVFEIGALPFESFSQGGNQYGNTMAIRGTPNRGWGFGRPTYQLILDYGNDPRKDASIIFLGDELGGVITVGDPNTPDVTYDANNDTIEIECYNQKIWTEGTNIPTSFGNNKRVIRYADVLLMAAETLNENGNQQQALIYLEMVRSRARGSNNSVLPPITTTNQQELRLAIYRERRFELAFEGLRFWDLVRTGRAESVLGPLGFKKGKHELFPIPQVEVDISEGTITQNPGY